MARRDTIALAISALAAAIAGVCAVSRARSEPARCEQPLDSLSTADARLRSAPHTHALAHQGVRLRAEAEAEKGARMPRERAADLGRWSA